MPSAQAPVLRGETGCAWHLGKDVKRLPSAVHQSHNPMRTALG